MNPPKTAQIVKTKLLDRVLSSESLLNLSVTSGIFKLKSYYILEFEAKKDLDLRGIRTNSVLTNFIPGYIFL